jgi:hypothetical protein
MAMLATLGGALALVIGLAVLLLPLLLPEMSRARDAVWGAVVLLLGLVLVTSAERLRGAPMLGVLCGGLLIGRLSVEVAQARWRQLSEQEQQRFWSPQRWQTALQQFGTTAGRLPALVTQASQVLLEWLQERKQPKASGKRWVRPEPEADPPAPQPEHGDPAEPVDGSDQPLAPAALVESFAEIDALITAASDKPSTPPSEAG